MSHSFFLILSAILLASSPLPAADAPQAAPGTPPTPATAPVKYLWAKAFHIPPETNTEESGYFSLCEGPQRKIYVGCKAAYGRDSYLVEFDPATEKMRIVFDTHKVCGLPLTATGYAAQSKIHTRNFVGPSGKIYVGSKQGYPTAAEHEALKRGEKIPIYKGGYVMTYDPATDKASENLGDAECPGAIHGRRSGAKEGQGVIDVTADESRGLIYVITCEEQHWMIYDTKHPDKGYREIHPGLALRDQPNTIIDKLGRANAITSDYKLARYNPDKDAFTVVDILIDNMPLRYILAPNVTHPDWRLAADGTTAYMQTLNDARLVMIDLGGAFNEPAKGTSLGDRLQGKSPDSRGSISIAPDGLVYSAIGVDNTPGFAPCLLHVVRYDSASNKMRRPRGPGDQEPGFLRLRNPAQKPRRQRPPEPRLPDAPRRNAHAAVRHHGHDRRPRRNDLRHDAVSVHADDDRGGQIDEVAAPLGRNKMRQKMELRHAARTKPYIRGAK